MKGQLEQMLNNAQAFHDHQLEEGGELSVGKQRTFPKKLMGKGNKAARNARDKKFGYGGQKKRSKKNDARSFNEFVQPGNSRDKKKKMGNKKMKKKRSR